MEFIIEKILGKAITESNTVSLEQLRQIIDSFATIFRIQLFLIAFIEGINVWLFYRLEKKIKNITNEFEKILKNS